MNQFATEFEFILPRGYYDGNGNLHRHGVMRLATAADEILPQKEARVQNNPAYLVVILMARVIVRLGELDTINPKVIEDLFAVDLAYLQDFYNRINSHESRQVHVECPNCRHGFLVEPEKVGES
jgi:hypothetical protein